MKNLKRLLITCLVLFVVYVFSVFLLIVTFDSTITDEDIASADYVLILGSRIEGYSPGARMEERLNYAIPILNQTDVPIIVSGGQGPDEDTYEAYVMKDYLVENGIDESRIIVETNATSTYENLIYSSEFITEDDANVLVISSDYHMFRVDMLCNRQTYNCIEGGSDTAKGAKTIRREIIAVGKSFVLDW